MDARSAGGYSGSVRERLTGLEPMVLRLFHPHTRRRRIEVAPIERQDGRCLTPARALRDQRVVATPAGDAGRSEFSEQPDVGLSVQCHNSGWVAEVPADESPRIRWRQAMGRRKPGEHSIGFDKCVSGHCQVLAASKTPFNAGS